MKGWYFVKKMEQKKYECLFYINKLSKKTNKMWWCNGYYIGLLLQRSWVRILIEAFCKKKKKRRKTQKPVQHGSPVFPVFTGFDRFSGKVNQSIEPDRCHGRFAVQPVEPAGPVRFSKHWLYLASTPFHATFPYPRNP